MSVAISPSSPSRSFQPVMEHKISQPGRTEPLPQHDVPGLPEKPSASEDTIRKLKARANRGLIHIAAFIAISIFAVQNLNTLQTVPERIRHLLGTSPTAIMISALLIIYIFSAILMTLSRMTTGSGSYSGLSHVGYLTGFYLFYYFSGSLTENFWAVFAAGMTILGLEAYHIWAWCREEIRREKGEIPRREPGDE